MLLYGRHRWSGETRRRYVFDILFTDSRIPPQGGVYIFVRRRFIFFLIPLYVGKAANLKSRLSKHERWVDAFWKFGATEKHVRLIADEAERQLVEEDLIRRLKPRMNRQLTPRGREDGPNNARLLSRWERRNYWKKRS